MPSLFSLPGVLPLGNRSGARPASRPNSAVPLRGRAPSALHSATTVTSPRHDIPTLKLPLDASGHNAMSGTVVVAGRTGLCHGCTAALIDELGQMCTQPAKEKHQSRLDVALGATERLGPVRRPQRRTCSRIDAGMAAVDQLEARKSHNTPKFPPPDWAHFRRSWVTTSLRHSDLEGTSGDVSARRLNDFTRMVTC